MIKIKNLNKYYNKNKSNELHVIDNTNLEITSPGLVTFLGSSGAGKSTLLHVIGGLDKAKGDIIYDDTNILKSRSNAVDNYRNKHIGYIFQNYNLLPNLTVYENLKVQLELINIFDKQTVDEKINECLKIVGLEKYKRRKVTALSGGQQQRVAIARALVKGAEVIIADEPTGNLDTKNSIEILNILKILSKKYLIILVTHNVNLAYHYSDRIIKIKDGRVVEDIQNNNNNSLLHIDSNAIYTKDYNKDELEKNIFVYTKNNEDVNFRIIIENDTIYIENNNSLPIRVLNDNTDRYIIENDIEEDYITEDSVLNLNYISSEKLSFKHNVKNFFKDISSSFMKLINGTRKTKLLYVAFIFIGIILCLCLNSLSISTTISNDYLIDVPVNSIQMDSESSTQAAKFGFTLEPFEIVEMLEENEALVGIVDTVDNPYINFKIISNRSTTININRKCFITTPTIYKSDIELGDYEIAISKRIADEIIYYTKGYQIDSYDKLIGKEFEINLPKVFSGDAIIKEIIDVPNYTFLVSDYMYFSNNAFVHVSSFLNYYYDEDNTIFAKSKSISDFIPNGDVFVAKSGLPNVVINKNLVKDLIEIDFFATGSSKNKIWTTGSDKFNVVGYIEEEGFDVIFSREKDYLKFIDSSIPIVENRSYLPYENYNITLTEGSSYPVNDYEIILPNTISIKEKYPLGSAIRYTENYYHYFNLKVVGYFEVDYPTNIAHMYLNYRTSYLIRIIRAVDELVEENAKKIYFYTNDYDSAISYIEEIGYSAGKPEEIMLQNTIFEKINVSKLVIVISICIIIVMILFIFFINRSKMMQNIYDIGVLRALGAKKHKIYKEYILDSIIVTTFTVVLGFTLAYFFTYNADNFIPGISVDLKYYFISIAIIYFVMIIASLLPIMTLLRKTPIEIINKYDI